MTRPAKSSGDSELDERLRRAELALYGGGGRTSSQGHHAGGNGIVHASVGLLEVTS